MNDTQDLFLSKDILPLFDYTLNSDSHSALYELLQNPLSSIAQINDRQAILKQIILSVSRWNDYYYPKIEYADSHKFLCHFPLGDLKKVDFLTYKLKKQKNNILLGEYAQLINFLSKIENDFTGNIELKEFPHKYQEDLRFVINYLHSFKLQHYLSKIRKGKLGYTSIQELNAIVSENRKNGDTLLFFEKLALFEAYLSIGKAIYKNNFQFATMNENCFQLTELYHPLLSNPVKNDIVIKNNIVLITGANMSGKSTLLKSIGLCVYLTHLGLAMPASAGTIPFYDHVSIQINHSDDLKNGYSHFMNEIIKLKNVIHQAHEGKRCFAIFDELFKGTNYEDALAISVKTIKGLQKFATSTFFISTHIIELRQKIAEANVQVSPYYIDCKIVEETPTFSYVLKTGWSNLQIGQLLFNKEGLNNLLD